MKGRKEEGKEGDNEMYKVFSQKEKKEKIGEVGLVTELPKSYSSIYSAYTHIRTHIPWAEGGWWATVIGLQKVGHDLATK